MPFDVIERMEDIEEARERTCIGREVRRGECGEEGVKESCTALTAPETLDRILIMGGGDGATSWSEYPVKSVAERVGDVGRDDKLES